MIYPGDLIYVDEKFRMYSKFKVGRLSFGQYDMKNKQPMKEGTMLKVSITRKGIQEVERLKAKEVKNGRST